MTADRRCAYRVCWSEEDGEWVATVTEYPSLSWLAPTPTEALTGLVDLVRDTVVDRERWGMDPRKADLREREGER